LGDRYLSIEVRLSTSCNIFGELEKPDFDLLNALAGSANAARKLLLAAEPMED
jgi:hypothetical protein